MAKWCQLLAAPFDIASGSDFHSAGVFDFSPGIGSLDPICKRRKRSSTTTTRTDGGGSCLLPLDMAISTMIDQDLNRLLRKWFCTDTPASTYLDLAVLVSRITCLVSVRRSPSFHKATRDYNAPTWLNGSQVGLWISARAVLIDRKTLLFASERIRRTSVHSFRFRDKSLARVTSVLGILTSRRDFSRAEIA